MVFAVVAVRLAEPVLTTQHDREEIRVGASLHRAVRTGALRFVRGAVALQRAIYLRMGLPQSA